MAVGYRGGLITGKIGGDVGYMVKNAKGRVSQGWRAYQAHVANPNNYAQRYNRVLLSTMARAYSVLRPICDHSFEGVAGASRNQKEFAKVNMAVLQELAKNGDGNYNEKGNFNGVVNPLYLSKGSLPSLIVNQGIGQDGLVIVDFPTALPNEAANVTFGDLFDAMGWEDSGQITICWCETDGGADIQLFRFARYVFRLGVRNSGLVGGDVTDRNSPLFTVSGSGEDPVFSLNYYRNESVGVGDLKVVPIGGAGAATSQLQIGPLRNDVTGFTIQGVAAINSALIGNTWKRSTQRLELNVDGLPGFELERAIASYADVKDSSQYLNH